MSAWNDGLTVTLCGSQIDDPTATGHASYVEVEIGIDELTAYTEAEDGGADEYDNGLEPNPVSRLRFVVRTVGLMKYSSSTILNTEYMPWVKYLLVQRIFFGRTYAWIKVTHNYRAGETAQIPRADFDDTDDWWENLLPYPVVRDGAIKPSLTDGGIYEWEFELKGRRYYEGND